MVFDIGDVKGREWKVEKRRRRRGLLLKHGIGRGEKCEGRGREEREKKGRGAACPNNKKSFPRPTASKHQFGRPVKMLQTSWPLMGFAIRQTQSSRKFQSQDQLSYQCHGQVANAKAFAFKTKVTFHNMPRNKRIKGYFAML